MRSYPTNSPEAAARIVALIVIADGDIGHAEALWLDRLAVHDRLGLPQHELYAQLDIFLEDLLSSGQLRWADTCPVDDYTLTKLLGEIQDPELQRKLLRLCVDLADIDAKVDDGESAVLVAAVEQWGLQHEMLLPESRH